MSSPMEISVPNPADFKTSEQNGVAPSPPPASPSPIVPHDKFHVSVEVCLKPSSTARPDDVRKAVEQMLEKRSLSYVDGPVPVPIDDPFLMENVQRIRICDTDEWVKIHDILLFWQVKPVVHVFQLSEEGPCEELSGDGQLSSFNEWILPAKEFDGMWESLIYESGLKQRLLRYAASALLFTEKGVDPFLVSWNRYPQCQLVEVNAHSLFSKWFSESGKLVAKLFQKIQEMVEEENNLVFVLIDEVESLAAARKAALSGSEPSDSIRVVNALLTQMDKLKSSPNVIILTTSNITAAIDIAFVDRADIKAYIGPPTLQARYEILKSCLNELIRTGIISSSRDSSQSILPDYVTLKEKLSMPEIQEVQTTLHLWKQLLEAAEACEGLSGRSLRKLPFLAHAALNNPYCCDPSKFFHTMIETARRERSELPD
ncbi:PREDICTED: pachytene checkpoint protein 2 homolog isoform X2 [Theobroma cacao]|uniref:Pachytene checkpoint protein 2 homolog n=1 Tax=Theobroma cacao TaxID=3641 RepID=A0AB32W4C5_THECC|nr:PREDICTED: pachytene checkpoint protein 2 homolog isoform X2 [Theobroma cacao]